MPRIFDAGLAANIVKDAGKGEAEGKGDNSTFSQSAVKTVHHLGSLVLVTLRGRSENAVINITLNLYDKVLVAVTPACENQIALLTVKLGGDTSGGCKGAVCFSHTPVTEPEYHGSAFVSPGRCK